MNRLIVILSAERKESYTEVALVSLHGAKEERECLEWLFL